MAQTNVSNCVVSILASFSSSLDVFKKFREKQSRKKGILRNRKQRDQTEAAEASLVKSLRQGPEDIGREYQKSILTVGDHFAVGDATAQTSLAETLLRLNTGLVTIINTFLARDKKDVKLDYRALTSLSERSRVDTCRALRQLCRRLTQKATPVPVAVSKQNNANDRKNGSTVSSGNSSRRKATNTKHTKVRSPMLAKVVIANSSKPSQIAMVKPRERKKKPGSASSDQPSSESLPALSTSVTPPLSAASGKHTGRATRPMYQRSQTLPGPMQQSRVLPTQDVAYQQTFPPPVRPRAIQSSPRLDSMLPPPPELLHPMPASAPLRTNLPHRRRSTRTYYSIASDSTKLGEIPLHRWPEPYDFDTMSMLNREAEKNGWPVSDVDESVVRKKTGMGIFRMFRRQRAGTRAE